MSSDSTEELSDGEVESMRAAWQSGHVGGGGGTSAIAPVQPAIDCACTEAAASPSTAVSQLAEIVAVGMARASELMALCSNNLEAAVAHHYSAISNPPPFTGKFKEIQSPKSKASPRSKTFAARGPPNSNDKRKGSKKRQLPPEQHSITSFFDRPEQGAASSAKPAKRRAIAAARPTGESKVQVLPQMSLGTPSGKIVKAAGGSAATSGAFVKLESNGSRTAEHAKEPTANARWMMAHRPGADKAVAKSEFAVQVPPGVKQPLSTSVWAFVPADYINTWSGQRAPYALLAEAFTVLEGTTKRLEITSTLTNAFRCLIAGDRASLVPALYLSTDRIAPTYTADVAPISIGPSILQKAIQEATGANARELRAKTIAFGDLGDAAVAVRSAQRTLAFGSSKAKTLLIDGENSSEGLGLYSALHEISRECGSGSQERKRAIIARLLVAAQGWETKYVVRTLEGQLRVGASIKTVLAALAHAFTLSAKPTGASAAGLAISPATSAEKEKLEACMAAAAVATRECYSRHPNILDLCDALWQVQDHRVAARAPSSDSSCWALLREICSLSAGVPIEPMLGQIARDFRSMSARAVAGEKFACEWKYDGQRGQIHRLANGRVRIFSRHLQDTTSKFPSIAALFDSDIDSDAQQLSRFPETFVIDCVSKMI